MDKDKALKLYASKFWEHLSDRQIAEFQLQEPLLCVPFARFHKAVEKAIGRPVYTHEFVDPGHLLKELRGEAPPRSMREILDLIPQEKLIVIGI